MVLSRLSPTGPWALEIVIQCGVHNIIATIELAMMAITNKLTSSCTSGGNAARNSGLTDIRALPSTPAACCEGGGGGGRNPSCSDNTSRLSDSGSASKKEGSTPSGIDMPSIVRLTFSLLVLGSGCAAADAPSGLGSSLGSLVSSDAVSV